MPNTKILEKCTQSYKQIDRLKDGRTVLVRAITPEDKCFLAEGLRHLSARSIYFRFFIFKDSLSEKELDYFTNIDFHDHVGIIIGLYENNIFSPVGTGRYIVSDKKVNGRSQAEFALTVAEEFQGQGFGTTLFRHLVKIGREAGIDELFGLVLPENLKMLNLLSKSGFKCRRTLNSASEWEFIIDLKTSPLPSTNPKG